ncbi:MAG: hypothetical protein Q8O30_02610 [Candidatus Omnitrophota bacterium]|nr:hypothetical protein [Candidatus Omnitrophota bacterium]
MIKIRGEIQKGLGAAKNTIQIQKPFLRQYLSEIESCHDGTINVLLEQPLIIFSPDIVTPPIFWLSQNNSISEEFGFLKIKLEILNKSICVDAWIYIAYKSPHYANPFYIEIIAPYIDIQNASMCSIIIDKGNIKELASIVIE